MPQFARPIRDPAAARRGAPTAAAPAAARRAGPRPGLVWQVLQRREQGRAAQAKPGVIQCKKVKPGACTGFTGPAEGSEIPAQGFQIPMWSYKYTGAAAKADRAEAMQLATEAYAMAGSAVDKPYLTRTELDELIRLGKLPTLTWTKGVAKYRNDNSVPLVDPFIVTIATTYTQGKDTKTLEVDAQFASQLSGYIIKVKDTGLGVADKIQEIDPYLDTVADEKARPAAAAYSQYHHKTGKTPLKDLLAPVEKTANPAVREKGVDAITKAVAEGGRFEAVKLMGGDLADETIFYADKDQKRRGIRFSDLWLCWDRSFGKAYSIKVSVLKDKVLAGGIRKTYPSEGDPDMVQADVKLPLGTHFDLVGAKKVVVAPPAPQPVPQSVPQSVPQNAPSQPSVSPAPSAPTEAPTSAKPIEAPSTTKPATLGQGSSASAVTPAPKPAPKELTQQPAPNTVLPAPANTPPSTPATTLSASQKRRARAKRSAAVLKT